jgi:hypothetical protein
LIMEWLCIGGPLHGTYRPAGQRLVVPDPCAGWTHVDGMAIPPRPVVYEPTTMESIGWKIDLPIWCEMHIAIWSAPLVAGLVLPGGVVGRAIDAVTACRWCYGRPMEGLNMCSRIECITSVATLMELDTIRAEDAMGWADDEA